MKHRRLLIVLGVMFLLTLTACSGDKEKIVDIEDAQVGDTIEFGTYEQDGDSENGSEKIEWLVLAKEDGLLVISKKVLASMAMRSDENVTWENSVVRPWLNDTFLQEAFSDEEQKQIQSVTVKTAANPIFGTDGGNDTTDKLFVLSYEEATTYFDSEEARQCEATAAALEKGTQLLNNEGMARWWLRTLGYSTNRFVRVSSSGVITEVGEEAEYDTKVGVRPAMWIAY